MCGGINNIYYMKNYDNLCKNYIEYININCDSNKTVNNKTQELQCNLIQNILDGCIKFKEKT
jgi:hypothetical protein